MIIMKYRAIRKEDAETIFSLGKSDFGSKSEYSWDWSIEKIKQYLKKSVGFGIICLDNDAIIGFVLVEKNYSSQKPEVSWLNYIFVKEEYRHKNLGAGLLEQVFLKLKTLGKTDLITDVYLKNTPSLNFFKSNSFEVKETWAILSRRL